MTTFDRAALSRVIAVANGKGGAGKTSVAAHIAGLSAAAGWRTLLIDLDPQGNAGHDLGYAWRDQSDNGQHLLDTLVTGSPMTPVVTAVRDNLDAICGGLLLDDIEALLGARHRRDGDAVHSLLAGSLAPLAEDYDLVVIDTPPTRPVLLRQALTAAHWVVVPTQPDRSSITGLAGLAHELGRVREDNPEVAVLGAVLFDLPSSASVVLRNAREDVTDALDGQAPVFDAVIRSSKSAAVAAREAGILAHELAEKNNTGEPWWKALQEGRRPSRTFGSATALAEDYALLTQEVLTSIADHEAQEKTA